MKAPILAVSGLACFAIAYRFYSSFIERKIFSISEYQDKTPAEEFEDGLDFVPTRKHILFGHHFTSIAGAAPIIGPCIAAFWGWLPALLWVILGTIFMGAVHDFGALVISIREKGRTIADITGQVISVRVRIMFLLFVLMLTWLVLAVFAMAIAGLFVSIPSAVLPINIEIIIAIAIGWLIYKKRLDAIIPSIVALVILYLFVWLGTKYPLSLEVFGMTNNMQNQIWIIFLFLYSGIVSLLPVWFLLQPRDYINSHQLIVGLALIFLGLFIANPVVDAPIIRLSGGGAPPIFPFLFVTIACGAISGFHGLVASGTTSKQISSIDHARFIGYGGMLGEGSLALASTLAAVAGMGLITVCNLPSVGMVENLSWAVYYDSWAHATTNKATAFVLGGGALIEAIGVPGPFAKTLMAVLVISFAATTLDTATRIQRFIITEIGTTISIRLLQNRYIATILALFPSLILTMWNVQNTSTGEFTQAGWALWPIFGASNQMLAALTLMILSLYFFLRKKPVLPLVLPFLFITAITLTALILKIQAFWGTNRPLAIISIILFVFILWMVAEGCVAFKKGKRHQNF